jgi:thermitase
MDGNPASRRAGFFASLFMVAAAFTLAGILGWAAGAPTVAAQTPVNPAVAVAPAPRFQAGELLVRFRPGLGVASAEDVMDAHGLRQMDEIPALGVRRVRVPAGQEESLAAVLGQDPRVAYAELNGILTVQGEPNDPYFSSQWGMTRIGAPAAWDQVTGTYPITIAVVDTGVWGSHPDLAAKMVDGWYRYDDGGGVIVSGPITAGTNSDQLGHGTHVAGIAAASTNNGIGVAGVSWGAPIMPFRVFKLDFASDYDVSVGILWVTDRGAKVINLSLGGPDYAQTLADAVAYAWAHGAIVVAAAGNANTSTTFYPAAYPNVLGVANAGTNDVTTNYPSGPGGYGSWVDVAAPGQSILSTYNNGGYAYMSGTSMATPHVAGLAALIWAANPSLTNAQVIYTLTSTAEKVGPAPYDASGWNQYLGYGRLHWGPALAIAKAGPAWFEPAAPLTYTLSVVNGGIQAASGLVITDALPAGASYLAASDGGVQAGGVVSWTVGSLAIGQTVTRTLTVSATQTLVNSAYGAVCLEGASVWGSQAVTSSAALYHLYLPLWVNAWP